MGEGKGGLAALPVPRFIQSPEESEQEVMTCKQTIGQAGRPGTASHDASWVTKVRPYQDSSVPG